MSQASSSTCLQRPLFLIALFLIDLGQISFVAKAMRPYPAYPPPAAWTQQQQQQYTHHHQQRQAAAASSSHPGRDNSPGYDSKNERQMLDPAHSEVLVHYNDNCGGAALSSLHAGCARSPAPEVTTRSKIDPRYGVEKRLGLTPYTIKMFQAFSSLVLLLFITIKA